MISGFEGGFPEQRVYIKGICLQILKPFLSGSLRRGLGSAFMIKRVGVSRSICKYEEGK